MQQLVLQFAANTISDYELIAIENQLIAATTKINITSYGRRVQRCIALSGLTRQCRLRCGLN
jgi:hypothetical protein